MKHCRLFILGTISMLLSACVTHYNERVGVSFPDNKEVINDIFVINGKPVVRYNKVTVYQGQQLVFLGPDKFFIQFQEGSFFEDSDTTEVTKQANLIKSQNIEGDRTGIYPSHNGVVILRVSKKKTEGMKVGTEFKYSVIVDGQVLDPVGRYGGTEH